MANYIALLGAYERDNFGDILFMHVNRRLLSPWPVVPLGLVSSDMTKESGGLVISASAWFDVCGEFLPHAIVYVGGEVMTCDLASALAFTVPDKYSEKYSKLNPTEKDEVARSLSWRSGELPYLDCSKYVFNDGEIKVRVAYNSIGGTKLDLDVNILRLNSSRRCLVDSNFLSVRDTKTRDLLSGYIDSHVKMHPDVVNLVSSCCDDYVCGGREKIRRSIRDFNGNYLLFQASIRYLTDNSINEIVEQLYLSAMALGCGIVLQPAGLAFEHDSFESLLELRRLLIQKGLPESGVLMQEDRDVWSQVAAIADSRCYIGTSLHGRIVASSYSRPRVSLGNKKVNAYAESWDGSIQPYDVTADSIAKAVSTAINTDPKVLINHASEINSKASEGYKSMKEALDTTDIPAGVEDVLNRMKEIELRALYRECAEVRKYSVDVSSSLSSCSRAKRDLDYKLNSIRTSWSWRLMSPLRSVKKLFINS